MPLKAGVFHRKFLSVNLFHGSTDSQFHIEPDFDLVIKCFYTTPRLMHFIAVILLEEPSLDSVVWLTPF